MKCCLGGSLFSILVSIFNCQGVFNMHNIHINDVAMAYCEAQALEPCIPCVIWVFHPCSKKLYIRAPTPASGRVYHSFPHFKQIKTVNSTTRIMSALAKGGCHHLWPTPPPNPNEVNTILAVFPPFIKKSPGVIFVRLGEENTQDSNLTVCTASNMRNQLNTYWYSAQD